MAVHAFPNKNKNVVVEGRCQIKTVKFTIFLHDNVFNDSLFCTLVPRKLLFDMTREKFIFDISLLRSVFFWSSGKSSFDKDNIYIFWSNMLQNVWRLARACFEWPYVPTLKK